LIEGKLFRGTHFIGGNLAGHIAVNILGVPCNCGFVGCLETEASSWALPSIVDRLNLTSDIDSLSLPALNFFHLFSAADQGNAAAKKVIDHCVKTWAMAAVNVTHMYDPEVIIVSGGIMQRSNDILPQMQQYIDNYSWLSPGSVTVLPALQVEYAGLLGMSYLSHSIQTT
jgi:glucokinase